MGDASYQKGKLHATIVKRTDPQANTSTFSGE